MPRLPVVLMSTVPQSVGVWLAMQAGREPGDASLRCGAHALVKAVPLALLGDRRDIGSSSEEHRLYVYDFAEGGIGLAEKAYHVLETLLSDALTLLRDFPCSEGCPSCMHLPGCPKGNGSLDKLGGRALLEGRSAGGARASSGLLLEGFPRDRSCGEARPQRPRMQLRDIA